MICPNCKTENAAGTTNCLFCGWELNEADAKAASREEKKREKAAKMKARRTADLPNVDGTPTFSLKRVIMSRKISTAAFIVGIFWLVAAAYVRFGPPYQDAVLMTEVYEQLTDEYYQAYLNDTTSQEKLDLYKVSLSLQEDQQNLVIRRNMQAGGMLIVGVIMVGVELYLLVRKE